MADNRRATVQSSSWANEAALHADPVAGARIAVGADLTSVRAVRASLDRFGDRYRRRLFSEAELADTAGPTEAEGLAARFAGKEAVFKALAVGADGLPWRSVEVQRRGNGAPSLALSGPAAALAAQRGLDRWAISLTHEGGLAGAVVVASGSGPTSTDLPEDLHHG